MKKYIALFLLVFAFQVTYISPVFGQIDVEGGLYAYYPFSGNPNDESGNERHGTAAGGILLRADRAGNPGSAYQFDGNDDAVELGVTFADFTLPFSLSLWLERSSDVPLETNAGIIASNDGGTVYTGFFMSLQDNGKIAISYGDGGIPSVVNRRGIESGENLPLDNWVHVAVVFRAANDISIYFDGVDTQGTLIGSGADEMINGEYPARIGYYSLGTTSIPWQGAIDDVRVYERALSVEEVDALFELPPDNVMPDPSVIVTEIMKNPDDVTDSAGEWFELFNITDNAIDLNSWTIRDLDGELHIISQELLISPHNTLVLCKNQERDLNGDVPCDYQYTSISLGNKDDAIILEDDAGVEIDRVVYDDVTFPSPTGASLFYAAGPTDDNNNGSNWLESFERAPNYGNAECPECDDFGSPGTVDSGTLPVELVAFDVVMDDDAAVLTWETASEKNNAGFEIYQRTENREYVRLGWVNGAGTTSERQHYAFGSTRLMPGRHTFRIKQIDFDGKYAWSREVTGWVQLKTSHVVEKPYPNPFNPTTTLSFSVQQDQHVLIELVNMLGQRLAIPFDQEVMANTTYTVQVSGAGLSSGHYLLRVQGTGFVETHRVYLVK